ncbi:hypothetical protein DFP72DRAFT_944481, partial [Ephemerocybe angulata]
SHSSNTLLIRIAKTTQRMSLTPEEISEVIRLISAFQMTEVLPAWFAHDPLEVGFRTFFVYYWLNTVAMEVNLMWPRKWRWGKALFLVNRYFPMIDTVTTILTIVTGFRVYIFLSPKVHPNCIFF